MDMNNFFNDLQGKINQAIENSPAKDIEKNVKAMMTQGFSKLDLVTREEFDIQAQVLAKTRAKLEALELRMADLEARLPEQAAGKEALRTRLASALLALDGDTAPVNRRPRVALRAVKQWAAAWRVVAGLDGRARRSLSAHRLV